MRIMLAIKQDAVLNTPLSCHVRRMRKEDVVQVTQIDREAFPTMWPPVNFQHELDNRLAHYIVAYKEVAVVPEPVNSGIEKGILRLASRVKQLFGGSQVSVIDRVPAVANYVIGFIGIWMMADEAHIINLAVREQYRRQGVGELLLIAGIDFTTKLKASMMTLEVRPSNMAAQKLYTKYGFTEVGVRHGYYADNKEDALLMSTEFFTSASFQTRFQQLKEAHLKKLGMTHYEADAVSISR